MGRGARSARARALDLNKEFLDLGGGSLARPCRPSALSVRGFAAKIKETWGCSSAGRASRSQCEGREFDPPQLHHEFFLQNPGLVKYAICGGLVTMGRAKLEDPGPDDNATQIQI